MYKSWSFLTGIFLLIVSFVIASWGLYDQSPAYASSLLREDTLLAADGTSQSPHTPTLDPPAVRISLTENEEAGLKYAILSEYATLNLYRSIAEKFRPNALFDRMIADEITHITALKKEAENHRLNVPANTEENRPLAFVKIEEACLAGVNAEGVKSALFDDLISGTTRDDLKQVYSAIRNTSLNVHLPAFYRCK